MKVHFTVQIDILREDASAALPFKIRCLPMTDRVQKISAVDIILEPEPNENDFDILHDRNENKMLAGVLTEHESHLKCRVEGAAEIEYSERKKGSENGSNDRYLEFTNLTKPDAETRCLNKEIGETGGGNFIRAVYIMESLWHLAEKPDAKPENFLHQMLCICRMNGIPAKCVCGIISGNEKLQSWVEVYTDYGYVGVDPWNRCLTDETYMKLAQGRDLEECAIFEVKKERQKCSLDIQITTAEEKNSDRGTGGIGMIQKNVEKGGMDFSGQVVETSSYDGMRETLHKMLSSDELLIWTITKRLELQRTDKRIYLEEFSEKMNLPLRKSSMLVKRLQDADYVDWKYDGLGEEGTYVEFTGKWWETVENQKRGMEKVYGGTVEKFGKDRFLQLLSEIEDFNETVKEITDTNGDEIDETE